MSISNGQYANATNFNNAFLSKTVDTTTAGRLGLNSALAESGTAVTNSQRELNALWSFIGGLINQVKTYTPTWTASIFGGVNDSIVTKIAAILAAFDPTTGALTTRAAAVALASGIATKTVAFSQAMNSADYVVTCVISNAVDTAPIFLQCVVTTKTVDGFTVIFNAPTDTTNYVLEYRVSKAA